MDLKFVPFHSAIDPGFWNSLSALKLDVLGLDQRPLDVYGRYVNSDVSDLPARLCVDWNAFDEPNQFNPTWNTFYTAGRVLNKNTLEEFKKADKFAIMESESKRMWQQIESGNAFQHPEILNQFIILMYADLKKFNFYYWFAFPALVLPDSIKVACTKTLLEHVNASRVICAVIASKFRDWKAGCCEPSECLYFGLLLNTNHDVQIVPLSAAIERNNNGAELFIGFADPATLSNYPGWPMRNLVAAIYRMFPEVLTNRVNFLCLRQQAIPQTAEFSIEHSLVIQLFIDTNKSSDNFLRHSERPKCLGWEKNLQGQMGPKVAQMRETMDPVKLAQSAFSLNLKLMKWRIAPNLNLDKIRYTKCLLLGAGTLGCSVARGLLGWGVNVITFVDCVRVSYSNPARQSLFTFADCLNGGRHKAEAAACRLSEIFPGVKAEWHDLQIPMPGHPIGGNSDDFDQLERLIEHHDVIFLLMDTRESRWLPTVMAAEAGKLVINAALGFDSFLVMRHGINITSNMDKSEEGFINSNDLGCYFCSDVVTPGNSTIDRTLDQQCTVSRPGVSQMASAIAVELFVSLLQHPQGVLAPAPNNDDISEGVLGIVPHSIRGSVFNFSQFCPASPAFANCSACGPRIKSVYSKHKFEFVKRVAGDSDYLKEISGLSELIKDIEADTDVVSLSDDSASSAADI